MKRLVAYTLAAFCVFSLLGCNGRIARVLSEITNNMLDRETPARQGGMAISIFSDQGVVWRYDSDSSFVPFHHDDGIQIGQVSKQCTILAVLSTAQKYGIDLEAPIRQYLPDLFSFDVAIDGVSGIGDLKIIDILLETTGFIDSPPQTGGTIDLKLRLDSARRVFPEGVIKTPVSYHSHHSFKGCAGGYHAE